MTGQIRGQDVSIFVDLDVYFFQYSQFENSIHDMKLKTLERKNDKTLISHAQRIVKG